MLIQAPMDGHHEVVDANHRFASYVVDNEVWQFDHLEAFAMKASLELAPHQFTDIDVIVLFSNHCFTRSRMPNEPVDEKKVVMDGSEPRMLDRTRYELSRSYLPKLIWDLPKRHIFVADRTRPNYLTFELPPAKAGEKPLRYAVFFEIKKDQKRRRRLLLRVQSAYVLDEPSKRLLKADKIRFALILKRAYLA